MASITASPRETKERDLPRPSKSAAQIVGSVGMSAGPEYYSGRGAIKDDLNSEKLRRIHDGVKTYVGPIAAGEFVQMVAELPKLSATDFLLALKRLEANDWRWKSELKGSEKGLYPACEGTARSTVLEVLAGHSAKDQTNAIRGPFLQGHQPPRRLPQRQEDGDGRVLVARVCDNDLQYAQIRYSHREYVDPKLFVDKVGQSRAELGSVIHRMTALDPNFGKRGHDLKTSIEVARSKLDPESGEALALVYHAYERAAHGKGPSLPSEQHANPRLALNAALTHLNQTYGREIRVVFTQVRAEKEGSFFGQSDEISFLHLESKVARIHSRPWAVQTPGSGEKAGDYSIEQPGFRIGDTVSIACEEYLGEHFVVVNGTHQHNGFGEGTRRIQVENLKTGTREFVVPWLLRHDGENRGY